MAKQAVFGLVLLCLLSTAYSDCTLAQLLANVNLCSNGVCTITSANVALLTTLCGAVVDLTNTATTPVTINFAAAASLSVGTLNVGGSATSTTTVTLPNVVTVANNLAIGANAVVNVAAGAVVTVQGSATIAAGATLNVAGNVTVAGTAAVLGTLHLAGTVATGAAQNAWFTATATARTVSVGASTTTSAQAAITGNGGIDANVVLSGNVTIAAGNSPGNVYINGALSMSSSTTLEIDVDSRTNFDRIFIRDNFHRDGILHADFEGSYVPDSGDSFTFATHSSADGNFNLARGNFDKTLAQVHPRYEGLSTYFVYGSASAVALPLSLIALCIAALVF